MPRRPGSASTAPNRSRPAANPAILSSSTGGYGARASTVVFELSLASAGSTRARLAQNPGGSEERGAPGQFRARTHTGSCNPGHPRRPVKRL